MEPPDWQSCRDCEGQPRSHRPQQPRFGDKDKEGVTQGRTDVWHGWTRSKGSHCVSHSEKTTVRCCEEPRVRIWKKEHTHTHTSHKGHKGHPGGPDVLFVGACAWVLPPWAQNASISVRRRPPQRAKRRSERRPNELAVACRGVTTPGVPDQATVLQMACGVEGWQLQWGLVAVHAWST